MNAVLAPLTARLTGAVPFSDPEPEQVRAMPVILHIERSTPPARTALLEAAASAAVLVCVRPEPEWQDELVAWTSSRIRKVSRRARGAHWAAVGELPGRTVRVGNAEARALVPGLVSETPPVVGRLQISGSELPVDKPGPVPAGVPVLWLNPGVAMTAGKAAAQVGHGSMLLAAMLGSAELSSWAGAGCPCAVRVASRPVWESLCVPESPGEVWRRLRAVAVRDAGFTEVAPGTVTVVAQWV
ncbi:MAG TPA: peptidyl-tRNA hydrolase [Pseudonocardiaceae bacterium]|nr:peptidyl-tRNA hydrolase [Pseudonocardiaceae bacterium]